MSPVNDKIKEVASFATPDTIIVGTGDPGRQGGYPNFFITVNHWAIA